MRDSGRARGARAIISAACGRKIAGRAYASRRPATGKALKERTAGGAGGTGNGVARRRTRVQPCQHHVFRAIHVARVRKQNRENSALKELQGTASPGTTRNRYSGKTRRRSKRTKDVHAIYESSGVPEDGGAGLRRGCGRGGRGLWGDAAAGSGSGCGVGGSAGAEAPGAGSRSGC